MTQTLLQLSMPKVKKMSLLLNKTQSSYYPAFKSMLDSIDTGTNTLSCIVSFFCYLPFPLHSHPPSHLPLPPPCSSSLFLLPVPPPCSSSLSLFSLHYLPPLPPYFYLSLIPPPPHHHHLPPLLTAHNFPPPSYSTGRGSRHQHASESSTEAL